MKKILCIEDDPDIANVIEMALNELYDSRIITNAEEVMEALAIFKPNLILIDNCIGVTLAADIVREIKKFEIFKDIPFILCSGDADIQQIALEIEASAYLEKPFELSEFYKTIELVLNIKAIV